MSLVQDILFSFKTLCPVCRRGKLFSGFMNLCDVCPSCGALLGKHDVGDGASVLLIFLLGFLLVPCAWMFELAFAPPIGVHLALWGSVAMGIIWMLMPAIKAFIILLEYRHRPSEWKKD